MSLRRQLSLLTILLGLVGLAVCAGMAATTRLLHRSVGELSNAIESITAANETSTFLVNHHSSDDPTVRASVAAAIGDSLRRSHEHVRSEEERALVERLDGEVSRYFATPPGSSSVDALFETAYGDARRLARLNVGQARRAREHAQRSDALGSGIAIVGSVVLLHSLALGLFWFRRSTFRPFLALEHGMRQFASGDYEARVIETGSEETRGMLATFNRMARSIVQSRRRQLQYVAGVVHDLRNPLSAVQLAIGLLPTGGPIEESRGRSVMALIQRQLVRMNSIVGDLLNAARIEAGDLVLKTGRCELRSLTAEVVDLFQRLAPGHSLRLDAPSEVVIDCDGPRIEQVLNNLVSNAIRYSPAGTRVDVKLRSLRDGCTIEVSDQGSGFAPEERERIFDPFFRGASMHAAAVGAGLGLFSARRIVEAHGGRIDVTSRIGEGSVFSVFLPQVAKKPSAPTLALTVESDDEREPEPARA